MSILTLLKANIFRKKSGIISVIIMALIVVTATLSLAGVSISSYDRASKAYDASGAGDFIIVPNIETMSGTIDEATINKLKSCDGVSSLKLYNSLAVKSSLVKINSQKTDFSYIIQPFSSDSIKYALFNENLSDQTKYDEPNKGEIYLSVLSFDGGKVGDEVEVETNGKIKKYVIAGFIEDPIFGATGEVVKSIIMNQSDYYELENAVSVNIEDEATSVVKSFIISVFIDDTSKLSAQQIKSNMVKISDVIGSGMALTKTQIISFNIMYIIIISVILMAFLVMIVIVSLMVIGHNLHSRIEQEYKTYGILKAQGFTSWNLRFVVLMQYVVAAVIGTLLGTFLSIPVFKGLGSIIVSSCGLLPSHTLPVLLSLAVPVIFLLLISLYIIFRTHRIGVITPVQAITGNDYYDNKDASKCTISGKNRFSFSLGLTLRQVFSNLKQYIVSTVIVAMLVFFMISITGLCIYMGNTKNLEKAIGSFGGDIRVYYGNSENQIRQDVEAVINKNTVIDKKVANYFLNMSANDIDILCYVMDDPTSNFDMLKGKAPGKNGEIALATILSNETGKGMGDSIEIEFLGHKETYVVTGLFQTTTQAGLCALIQMDGGDSLFADKDMLEYLRFDYYLQDGSQREKICDELIKEFSSYNAKFSWYSFEDDESITGVATTLNTLFIVFYLVAAILSIIVVKMVCDNAFLKEKKDLSIYKAVGFRTSELRGQFTMRFVLVSFSGCILGIVLTIFVGDFFVSSLLSSAGITSYKSGNSFIMFLIPSLFICVLFSVLSWASSRKIRIATVRSLITE